MVRQQNKGVAGLLAGIGIGVIVALAISFVLLAVVASLIMNQTLSFSAVGVCSVVIHIISVYVAGIVAGRVGKYNALVAIGGMVLCMLLVQGFLGALVLNSGLGNIVGVVVPELAAGALAVITCYKSKGKHKKRKIKKRYL